MSEASACELYFRESLAALLHDPTASIPLPLREALVGHLHRRDGQGYSLCFANPERERLLDELGLFFLTQKKETL